MSRKQIGNLGPMRPKMDRATSKPLMEKRRRERINRSLNELKSILLEALRRDTTSCSKLEKADILEMTVRYLHSTKTPNGYPFPGTQPTPVESENRYQAGFVDCKAEMNRALASCPDLSEESRQKILNSIRPKSQQPSHISPIQPTANPAVLAAAAAANQYATMSQFLASTHMQLPYQQMVSPILTPTVRPDHSAGSIGTNGSDSDSDTNSNDSFNSSNSAQKIIFRPW